MQFSSNTLAVFLLTVGRAAAFSRPAFVPSHTIVHTTTNKVIQSRHSTGCGTGCGCPACTLQQQHPSGCSCASCSSLHVAGCGCPGCARTGRTQLFSTTEAEAEAEATDEEIPKEVEALDGINSEEEAHNAERPARESLKKKSPPKGKPLDEFEPGTTVSGKVKSITSYGAFIDIGAETDGLCHISQLSKGFVSDVKEFLSEGQDVEVRIVSIDKGKSQVALSLMTEEEAAAEQSGRRPQRQQQGGNRRDDSAAVSSLADKGWDTAKFVEGTVVSTVDFGAFVRVDVSKLNEEASGELDGLVHISALTAGRCNSVTDIVNVDQKVQIRIKSIDGRKVSLTMITPEQEKEKGGPRKPAFEGAKDWKESLEKFQLVQPEFDNTPMVTDLRK